MKNIILCLIIIFCCQLAYSQQRITKAELEMLKKQLKETPLLSETDADFKDKSVPGGWSTESAVILCQKTSFEFDKKGISAGRRIGRNIVGLVFALPTLGTSMILANTYNPTRMLIEETERRKLILNDKYAIEQYSILYFRFHAAGDAFDARVIKKDGSIRQLEFNDAIKVDDLSSIPGIFRSYTDWKFSVNYRPAYFKIAVPDLEEGDIIEYEFKNFNTRSYGGSPSYEEFDPVYYVCNREMPVAKQVIEVVTEDDRYYIGYKSLKGAPDFVQTSGRGKKVYRWEDKARDKMVDTRFVNEFMELPSVKFQVIYAKNNSRDFVWFKNEEEMKKDISTEDLASKAKTFWFNPDKLRSAGDYTAGLSSTFEATEKAIYKNLKKKGVTDGSEDEYVRKAYYLIRAQTLYNNWSDFAFAKVFSLLLTEKKIDHDIVFTTSNIKTNLNKVAFAQELTWSVRHKNKFYVNPGEHLNPEELPFYLSGNTAVSFNYKSTKAAPTTEVLPLGDTATNILITQIKASLNAGGSALTVEKNVEAKGQVKDDIIDEALALTPFMEGDYKNYDGMSMWEGLNSKQEEKAMEDFSQQKKEWKEEKPTMMKAMAEEEYGFSVDKYNSFRVVQDGRAHKKRSLKYVENFILADVTATAGEDILIPLPALIGEQTRIKKEERNRAMPLDLRYSRILDWRISFAIPAGYSVKGIESLNQSISNDCGAFMSIARVEGGNLVIDVRKVYRGKSFETNYWGKMVEIMDASYNFSQAKVLLKKL